MGKMQRGLLCRTVPRMYCRGYASSFVRNPYAVLGVARTADAAEIKAAYRELVLKFHPDRRSSETSKVQFQRVQDAYDRIGTPEARAEYDDSSHVRAGQDNEGRKAVLAP